MTMGDANAMMNLVAAPDIKGVAPVLQGNAVADYNGNTKTTTVIGVTPDYYAVRNITLLDGQFINESNQLGRASVAVIGVDVADALFNRRDGLVGETIRVANAPFRIIGVLTPTGGGSFGSQDNEVLVPITTAQARLISRSTPDTVDVVYVEATDFSTVQAASDEISQILRTRHRTQVGLDDFTVFTQQSILSTAQTVTGVLTIFLGGIAAISLLVGGIGIMNIMLVSVTERTREIGLRKALGARKRDILIQFLVESSLLSLFGGIIGILFGWLIAFTVGVVATALGNNFTPVVGLNAILLATIFSAAVGLFFGIYPANRAASLEPVEALRYE
jgi:putative ABC transport system permease protein